MLVLSNISIQKVACTFVDRSGVDAKRIRLTLGDLMIYPSAESHSLICIYNLNSLPEIRRTCKNPLKKENTTMC